MQNEKTGIHLIIIFFDFRNAIIQNGLKVGSVPPNIEVNKVLNYPSAKAYFKDLQNKITIVDFFGTWFVRCLRALPHLTKIKQKFKNDIRIVLVSDESEAQLTKFIKALSGFSFPGIVDENHQWNNLFQPPSLPYTVVINKSGKIISITEAELITETEIKNWLSDTDFVISTGMIVVKTESNLSAKSTTRKSADKTVQLSQDFIYAAKAGDAIDDISKNLDYQTLLSYLNSDKTNKAFWINLYNGYTQVALKGNPDKYKNRNTFFRSKNIDVAGKKFSMDRIEHGILRHSKVKWSLGYFNKLFPSKTEKHLRADKLDYRIHFALNCGAKSCPPIAFYTPETLDTQLELATNAYLTGEADYDSTNNIIKLPKLMSWFRADFGGKKGMINILKKHNIIPAEAYPKINFKKYDWTLYLNNYSN